MSVLVNKEAVATHYQHMLLRQYCLQTIMGKVIQCLDVNKTTRLKTKTKATTHKTKEGKTNTKTKTAVDKTDFQDQKSIVPENRAKKYFEKFSDVNISMGKLSRSVAGLQGEAVAVGRGRHVKGKTIKRLTLFYIHSANIGSSILMQWSHETIFVIVIFKISRLHLWAPLGDFCPLNHLVPSSVDDF